MPKMPSFSHIPRELLLEIASPLATTDLAALRLSSRPVNATLLSLFARRLAFSPFRLNETGLQTLLDVSSHPHFSTQLHTIVLTFSRDPTPQAYSPFRLVLADDVSEKTALLLAGVGQAMLARVFENVPGLKAVELRNAGPRMRTATAGDVPAQLAAAHPGLSDGWRALLPAAVFSTVVQALARAGCCGVAVSTGFTCPVEGLVDTAFVLPGFTLPETTSVLHSMQRLRLGLCMDATFNPEEAPLPTGSRGLLPWLRASHLQTYLSHTRNLTDLGLEISASPGSALPRLFLQWLALPPDILGDMHFSSPLRRLSLARAEAPLATYALLMSKFAETLVEIELTGTRMLVSQVEFDARMNPWVDLLRRMAEEAPSLERVSVSGLEVRGPEGRIVVGFDKEMGDGPYSGDRGYVGRLARGMVLMDDVWVVRGERRSV